MAVCYFGDGITVITGDWTRVANWYSTLGSCCSGICSPGAPLGRLPGVGDSVVLVGNRNASLTIIVGPSTAFAGAISWLGNTGTIPSGFPVTINTPGATYSGAVSLNAAPNPPGGVGWHYNAILAGNFPGAVSLSGFNNQAGSAGVAIQGGNFTGTVTRANPTQANVNEITGGTYKPVANCALLGGSLLDDTNLPVDPGFAVGGGTFAPVITVTGLP